jgi:hypothetical protein
MWGSCIGAGGAPGGGGEFGKVRWWRMASAAARRFGELLCRGGAAAGGLLECVPAAPWWRCWLRLSGYASATPVWWAALGHLLLLADTLPSGVCMASGESLAAVTPSGATLLLGGVDLMTALPSPRREVL